MKRLADTPGPLPVELPFDVGQYAPQVVTQTLQIVPPLYLPLVSRGGAR